VLTHTNLSHTHTLVPVHPTPCCPCPYLISHRCCMHVRLQQRFHHVQPRLVLRGVMQWQVAILRNSNNHEHYEGRQQQYKKDSSKALCCCLLPLHTPIPPPLLSHKCIHQPIPAHIFSHSLYILHMKGHVCLNWWSDTLSHTHTHMFNNICPSEHAFKSACLSFKESKKTHESARSFTRTRHPHIDSSS